MASISRTAQVEQFVVWLRSSSRWTAPYGVLHASAESSGVRYHEVTFGIARSLDATVRMYGPQFWVLRTSRYNWWQKFTALEDLKAHLSSQDIF